MTGFADEVILMLTALRAQPFLLVGHSMGGMLAQIIAAKQCRMFWTDAVMHT